MNDLLRQIEDFEQRIKVFGQSVSAEYDAVEDVEPAEKTYIESTYLPEILSLSVGDKLEILAELQSSWDDVEAKSPFSMNQRRFWMRWGKAASGVARYLLRPSDIQSTSVTFACDLVVRISRWHFTRTGFWKVGIQPARVIVERSWGAIERFRDSDGKHVWLPPGTRTKKSVSEQADQVRSQEESACVSQATQGQGEVMKTGMKTGYHFRQPLAWDQLKKDILDCNGRSQCPLDGCEETLQRQTSYFCREPQFQCSQHGIYVSPTTFEYPNERDNMLWKDEDDLALWSQIRRPEFKRESRVARERSEDAVTWNVVRFLERQQLVGEWLRVAINERVADPKVIYWSYCQTTKNAWQPLLDTCPMFGETTPRRSEPDVILDSPTLLVFVEAKLGSSNAKGNSKPKKYEDGCEWWFKQVFQPNSTFQSVAGDSEMYQLMRLWLIGSRIAHQQGKRFVLVNLVRGDAEAAIERLFGVQCMQTEQRRFVRATWEQIYEQVVMPLPASESKELMCFYFRNKTLGYKLQNAGPCERRILQRAFSLLNE